jgi:anthranilate phosphoribosyltransferase
MADALRTALQKVSHGCEDLGYDLASRVFTSILCGSFDMETAAALLLALHRRGETTQEVLGGIHTIQARQSVVNNAESTAIDVGGTGGDGGRTFNISTASAIVAAATGIPVYKHGSARASSACGSIDLLDELRIPTAQNSAIAIQQVRKRGIAFLASSVFQHYPTRLQTLRSILGSPTIFNLIGPWCNPARLRRQVIGVMNERFMPLFCEIGKSLHYDALLIVHGKAGCIDEFSIAGPTTVVEIWHGETTWKEIIPEDFGFRRAPIETIAGSNPTTNAHFVTQILEGRDLGPKSQAVLMEAGACIYVAGRAATLGAGTEGAAAAITSGRAAALLRDLQRSTSKSSDFSQ